MLYFTTDAEFRRSNFFHHQLGIQTCQVSSVGNRPGDPDIGTYEQRVYPDQLWRLEAEPEHPGYYYICNVQNNEYRIGKWGGDDQAVGNYNGQHFDDQLWKFEKYGDFYRIFNYKYEDAKVAKLGKGDSDWGTFDGKFFDDHLWKLTSLFESSLTKASVLTINNR